MKRYLFQPNSHKGVLAMIVLMAAAPILTVFAVKINAQGSQLSLADILIGLRSKKVTLTERNKMLTDAIGTRGTTFALTPEIEKELADTGADKGLLDSIRRRAQIANAASVRQLPVEPKLKEPALTEPVAQVPVQDLAFYESRAKESAGKGDLDGALVDYTKAVELDGSAISVRMERGRTYLAKRAFLLAIADFTKVIEVEPKNAIAFALRAGANEGQGNPALALDDYKKAFDLDPTIQTAKAAVERFNAEQANLVQKIEQVPSVAMPAALPEFVDLGQISADRATKMIKPTYPPLALQAGGGGQVVVEIELDTDGNVTRAKAISGSSLLRKASEDAARSSKFKPAMAGTSPIKAKARIVYSFIAAR